MRFDLDGTRKKYSFDLSDDRFFCQLLWVVPKNSKSDNPSVITGGNTPSDLNHQLNKGQLDLRPSAKRELAQKIFSK